MKKKKKTAIALHWINEYNRTCDRCSLNQCNAIFNLGIESSEADKKTGKLIQRGKRFTIEGCFAKELENWIEYIMFFNRFKRFGMPYKKGWLEIPERLIAILEHLDIETQFFRIKDG